MDSEADKKLEDVRDRSSHGTPSGPRLVDEKSQFRKPDDIKTVERGQKGLEKMAALAPGTQVRHGNILVKIGGVPGGGDGEEGGGGNVARLENRIAQLEAMLRMYLKPEAFLPMLKSNLPPELANASWNWAGQNPPPAGSVLQVIADNNGTCVGWGESGGGINFVTDGQVKVAGAVVAVSWTTNDASPSLVPNLWIEVMYDGSGVNIKRTYSGYPSTQTDRASVRIRVNGKNIQNCDYSLERVST